MAESDGFPAQRAFFGGGKKAEQHSAGGLVIKKRGSRSQICLVSKKEGRVWAFPKGRVNDGEELEATAVREVLEETGLEARVGKLLGVDSRVMVREEVPEGTAPELHTIRIVYRASVKEGPLRHEIDGSSDEARWVAIREIRSLRTLSLVQTGIRMAGIDQRGRAKAGGQRRTAKNPPK